MREKVFIEISKNSKIKYEFDKKQNCLVVDRFLKGPFVFPINYGFIPNTLADDGDPLDIMVISDYEILSGSMIEVKIIGVIILEDEKGMDEKIVSVPSESIDSDSKNINCLEDLPGNVWENIKYFFNHYKDLEENKYVRIHGFDNRLKALEIISKYKI